MNAVIYTNRLKPLKQLFLAQNCDAVIISHKQNIAYYTGLPPLHPVEREAFLLVTPKAIVLYHSPFIKPPCHRGLTYIPMSPRLPFQSVIKTYCGHATVIGIEKNNLTVIELERLQALLPDTSLIAVDNISSSLRTTKDHTEISNIKKAIRITTNTLKWVQNFSTLKQAHGITETQLRQELENHMLQLGADGLAFPTIVAFGDHSAFPHHQPGHRRLTPNSIILVDMGAQVNGYCADMTRTWTVGTPSPLFTLIETIVKTTHQQAVKLVKNGLGKVTCHQVDSLVHNQIKAAGYHRYFIHNTGHGVGLEAHELPSISTGTNTILQSDMVITIEPGIYLPHKFGYRHENTLII